MVIIEALNILLFGIGINQGEMYAVKVVPAKKSGLQYNCRLPWELVGGIVRFAAKGTLPDLFFLSHRSKCRSTTLKLIFTNTSKHYRKLLFYDYFKNQQHVSPSFGSIFSCLNYERRRRSKSFFLRYDRRTKKTDQVFFFWL